MATFKEMQDRIALDFLNRYDLIPEVKRAILSSIRSYEARRFWFNEGSTTSTTTANSASFGVPTDFLSLDRLELAYNGAQVRLLEQPFNAIREMNATSVPGVPSHFAYYGDTFQLAILPNSAYSVTVYHLKVLPTLSADTDTNAWTTEAQNLILHTATISMLSTVIESPNTNKLRGHINELQRAQTELNLRNSLRLATSLQATSF